MKPRYPNYGLPDTSCLRQLIALSCDHRQSLARRLKNHVSSASARPDKHCFFASPSHMVAILACARTLDILCYWDGPDEILERILSDTEVEISTAMVLADEAMASFPPGSYPAFGHTSGMPSVSDGLTACHGCGKDTLLESSVFLTFKAERDALLFVMHDDCYSSVEKDPVFDRICREDWMLLLMAQSVLSS